MLPDKLKIKDEAGEISRLVNNWRTLLNIMPEMVVIVSEDLTIEYMNAAAVKMFGDLQEKNCFDHLCNQDNRCSFYCPVKRILSENDDGRSFQVTKIAEIDVEYTALPFAGYKDQTLVMLLFRDVTQVRAYIQEIQLFNESIDKLLVAKINELNNSEQIRQKLIGQMNVLKRRIRLQSSADEIIGSSRVMQSVKDLAGQVAAADTIVLITGESGTGKELIANLLHKNSKREHKPFLKVNCSALNDNLLESDLFGYEKGAFTGAVTAKKGKLEAIEGGTIFLDEIGDISQRMQAALLRVLQNSEIIRVGGTQTIKVDVRIIAATNVDLQDMVEAKTFRRDLFYRLNVINIKVPPLRERKEDIADLAAFFVKKFRVAFVKEIDFLPNNIVKMLLRHDWPGNVRELENVIQRAVLMAKSSIITEEDILIDKAKESADSHGYLENLASQLPNEGMKKILAICEKDLITLALKKNKGNVLQGYQELKMSKTAFYGKLKAYGIDPANIR